MVLYLLGHSTCDFAQTVCLKQRYAGFNVAHPEVFIGEECLMSADPCVPLIGISEEELEGVSL